MPGQVWIIIGVVAILFALVMGTGGRVHARLGGLTKDKVSVHDGQR